MKKVITLLLVVLFVGCANIPTKQDTLEVRDKVNQQSWEINIMPRLNLETDFPSNRHIKPWEIYLRARITRSDSKLSVLNQIDFEDIHKEYFEYIVVYNYKDDSLTPFEKIFYKQEIDNDDDTNVLSGRITDTNQYDYYLGINNEKIESYYNSTFKHLSKEAQRHMESIEKDYNKALKELGLSIRELESWMSQELQEEIVPLVKQANKDRYKAFEEKGIIYAVDEKIDNFDMDIESLEYYFNGEGKEEVEKYLQEENSFQYGEGTYDKIYQVLFGGYDYSKFLDNSYEESDYEEWKFYISTAGSIYRNYITKEGNQPGQCTILYWEYLLQDKLLKLNEDINK